MADLDAWLIVGEIVAPQGLKGELRINPSSEFPERFIKPGKRWLQEKDEDPREIDLIKGRQLPGKSIFIVELEGITNRNEAEAIIGEKVLVRATDRPQLKEGEFHLLDLIGLEVKLHKNK